VLLARIFPNDNRAATILLLISSGIPWLIPFYLRDRSKHWRPGLK
jgi:hypothetical protein